MKMARAAIEIDAELAPPDSDRLADFPHPRETTVFHGHGEAARALHAAAGGGRMHHAWLLLGPEGVGRATLAYRFARYMLAPAALRGGADLSVAADAAAVRHVAAQSHPNLLVLRRPWQERNQRFATAITIDEVRRLRSFLGRTPGAGDWRMVIVDRAEDMNMNAANALLKSLEEPPASTVFLLVCAAPGRLPATVRSRCRTLLLQPLGEADLANAVEAAMEGAGLDLPTADALREAGRLAQGSVRRTLELLGDGGLDIRARLLALMRGLPGLDYGAVHALADAVGGGGGERHFEVMFGLLEDMVARLVRHGATGTGAVGEEATLASRLVPAHGLARWAELWEEVRRAKAEALALNLDRKALVLGVFFQLDETARATARQPL